jgi:hypothetical protein
MTPGDPLALAAAARAHVATVIALLERPTAASLDQSSVELAAAMARMEKLQHEFTGKEIACPAKAVIAALRQDVWRAGQLLRNAWELRIGRGSQMEYSKKGEWVRQPLMSNARWTLEA